ncbi:MAG: hypothetical protein MJZ48_00940 [Paludibacteraceae bacterium]|nr:hypothetical protein [Paludibacteraceae bacterium]
MKKIVFCLFAIAMPLCLMAQLPYDTEMTQSHFNNGAVVGKTTDCSWSLGAVSVGNLLHVEIPIISPDPADNSGIIVLPAVGLPAQIDLQYRSLSKGTISIEESANMSSWTMVWSQEVTTELISAVPISAKLSSSTRYIRLHYVGFSTVYFSKIKVTEWKELSVSTDEYRFANAMVGDPVATKSVKVNWTNIVASVTSTNPAFTVSTASIGEKNKENQTTNLVISYQHDVYGSHEGEIVLEGEGHKVVIPVSGTTSRYEQHLTWNQTLGSYPVTVNLLLSAHTEYGAPITYTSSDSSVAWVDSLGHVQIACAGMVDITAQQMGTYMYEPTAAITKSVTFTKVDPVVAILAEEITYGQAASEVVLTEVTGNLPGTMAFVDIAPDSVLDAGVYDLEVRFTPEDLCAYNTVERMVTLVVNQAAQTIAWAQEQTTLKVDETITLSAAASSGLPLTYAFTNCNITLDGNQMTGSEAGDVLVIAFQPGNKNYLPTTVVMQAFLVEDVTPVPTSERQIAASPTLDELNEFGQKYYHNGEVYIYYRAHIYTSEGKCVK